MTARSLIVLASVVLIVFLALERAEVGACTDARERLFVAATAEAPLVAAAAADDVRADCRDTAALIAGATPAVNAGIPESARLLLEEAVRREPENARAWQALARLTAERDPQRAREAAARAAELNPRSRPS